MVGVKTSETVPKDAPLENKVHTSEHSGFSYADRFYLKRSTAGIRTVVPK